MEWSRQSLIELEGINKNYDKKTVLKNLNFTMNQEDFVSIMGPSGSGKSTLINIIGLLDRSYEGSYRFNGKNSETLSERETVRIRASEIGYVFQAYHLIGTGSVEDNILLQAYYAHKPVDKAFFDGLVQKLGLNGLLEKKAAVLSGGEKQRVSIARALINRPRLIIADEPTGNLDEENMSYVSDIFDDLHKDGTAILMVTHDKRMAASAPKRYLLADGMLTEV